MCTAIPLEDRSLAYGHPTGGQGQAADSRHRSGWAHPGPDPAATSAQSPQKTRPPLLGPQHQKAVSSCVNSTEEVGLCLVLDACTLSVCMHGAPTADPGLHKSPQTLTQPCALPVSGHVVPALPWDSARKNTSPGTNGVCPTLDCESLEPRAKASAFASERSLKRVSPCSHRKFTHTFGHTLSEEAEHNPV